jgi:hypothetical protein
MSGGIISSLGVEIEFTQIEQDDMFSFLRERNIRGANIVNDASCTRTRLVIGDITVADDMIRNSPLAMSWATRKISGGEFVSPIIQTCQDNKDWFKPLDSTIRYMADKGEVPSLTAGIHVHVNVGGSKNVNIEFLTSLAKIWRKVEAAMYRITSGEMGYSRGAEQLSYCYYRPLVPKNGPAVVRTAGGGAVPCFDLEKLEKAKTVDDFFRALGRSDAVRGHYWATKYHGLNFQSILAKGTVELRTGNFTNNPRYLYAWIRTFQSILGLAWASYVKPLEIDQFPDLPLGYMDSFGIHDFLQIIPIKENEVIETLMELWETTRWSSGVEGYQWSHLGHGLGARMPETIVDFGGIKKELIPNPVPTDEVIHRPEEFAKDKTVTALRNVGQEDNHGDEPQIRLRRTPTFRDIEARAEAVLGTIPIGEPVDDDDDEFFDDDDD